MSVADSWIENEHLYIQTELCILGTLEDLISSSPSACSIVNYPHRHALHRRWRQRLGSNSSGIGSQFLSQNASLHHHDCVTDAAGGSGGIQRDESAEASSSVLLLERPRRVEGISEELAWMVLFDMARCLNYMHEKGMVVSDIFENARQCVLRCIVKRTRWNFG